VSQINFYIFLCIYEKFADFENRKEITEKLIIFCDFREITNSDPQIEGLCVNFPQISDFRAHFLQNPGPIFAILTKNCPVGTGKCAQIICRFLAKIAAKNPKKY